MPKPFKIVFSLGMLQVLGLLAWGCGGKQNPVPANCTVASEATTAYSYATDIKPLLQIYCLGCHSASLTNRNGAPVGVNFDTYADAVSNATRADEDILSGRMPLFAIIPPAQLCTFDGWVNQNFPP